jgi:glucose-6-phosphate isomerase
MLQKVKLQTHLLKVRDINSEVLIKTRNLILKEKSQLLFSPPYYELDDLTSIDELYNKLSHLDHWIVIGMGGAILNCKIYANFVDNTKIFFLDSLSATTIDRLITTLDFNKLGVIFISNGGNTIEIIALAEYLFEKYKINSNHIVFAYGDNNSLLSGIHKAKGGHFLQYDSKMGGRFSTFTRTTYFIKKLLQINIDDLYKGADKALQGFNAQLLPMIEYNTKHTIINCSYYGELQSVVYWFGSSLAEVVGKKDVDIKSIILNMPLDQHGLLQALILNYTQVEDKIFNIFTYQRLQNETSPLIKAIIILEDLLLEKLAEAKIPYRVFILPRDDFEALGELLTYLILEMIIAACHLGADPFTQPEIDYIKSRAAEIWCNK